MTSTVHGKSSAADFEEMRGHTRTGWMRSGGYAPWLLVLFIAVLSVTLAVVWNSQKIISVGSELTTVDHGGALALESATGFELHAALSPLGTILCVDSGEVVQYARLGTALVNGENVIRETNDSCEELTEEIQAMARHRLYAGVLDARQEEAGHTVKPWQGRNIRAVPRDADANDENEWVDTVRALNSEPTDTGDTEGLIEDASPLSDSVGYELYVGLSPQGTVLCSDNGVVEPYAVVEGELRGAEDQVREWTPECSLVVEEPKTVTTIKEDDQIHIDMIAPGELEVFDSGEELLANSTAIQREQGRRSLFCTQCVYNRVYINGCSSTRIYLGVNDFVEAYCQFNSLVKLSYCKATAITTMVTRKGSVTSSINGVDGNTYEGSGVSSQIQSRLGPGQVFNVDHYFIKVGCCLSRKFEYRLRKDECMNADFTPYNGEWSGNDSERTIEMSKAVSPALSNCQCNRRE